MKKRSAGHLQHVATGALLATGLCMSGAALATDIIQTVTITAPPGMSNSQNPTFSVFDGFDVAGETLDAVMLSWDLSLDLEVAAAGCSGTSLCLPPILNWNLGGTGGVVSGNPNAFGTTIFNSEEWNYGFTDQIMGLQEAAETLTTMPPAFYNFPAGDLAGFVASGPVAELQNIWASQAAVLRFDVQTLTGEIQLKYTYDDNGTPMPIPGTLALLGLGLAGIGVRRKRKIG